MNLLMKIQPEHSPLNRWLCIAMCGLLAVIWISEALARRK